MKPKLLLHPEKWSNATAFFLEPLFDKYFERVLIDDSKTYNPKECLVFSHWIDSDWTNKWRDLGFKVAIDHLWDPIGEEPGCDLLVRPGNWFCRANESLWYKALGYDSYVRKPNISKTFLLFMRLHRDYRDWIYDRIDLSDSIHSYHARGIELNYADDLVESETWQRHLNPDWYNITNFSLIVESTIDPWPIGHSEKTWKPMAYYHPFITWAPVDSLKELRNQGFQTFDHVIDESYDSEPDHHKRLDMISEQANRLRNVELTDDETNKRCRHNHDLFFDTAWSERQFYQNLFEPMLNLL